MELTLVRHGATLWNASRRFQGQTDVPLSPQGQAQARAIARALAHEPIDRVYASNLARARETARAIAEPHGLPVVEDTRLREFSFGAWEGLTWAEIVATRPHLREHGSTAAKLYAPEDGEAFAQVCARMGAVLAEIAAGKERHVVVVTHAGPLHAALAALALGPVDRTGDRLSVSFNPASLTRVAMEDGHARLITLNDVRHLDPPD